MSALVADQLGTLAETFAAVQACKGFFTSVNLLVADEQRAGGETFAAIHAWVGTLAGVVTVMLDEQRFLAEPFPAHCAQEGLGFCAGSLLRSEHSASGKSRPAGRYRALRSSIVVCFILLLCVSLQLTN